MSSGSLTAEERRLAEDRERRAYWRRWGSYVSERQWGTVREDYSSDGDAWNYVPHDHARSRAYRWGEDGIAGICDNHQRLCFALALWNGNDEILKERLFGLSNGQGNHGEDVKEYYAYLDNTPSHAYMSMLYKYPHAAFPYARLVDENARRSREDPEFELLDTGVFDDDAYFDVFVTYAKLAPDDIAIRIRAVNRGARSARLTLLPQLWFRNTWAWSVGAARPALREVHGGGADATIHAAHATLGDYFLHARAVQEVMFTDNETNAARLFSAPSEGAYVKDAFHEYVVAGRTDAVNHNREGTKCAMRYDVMLEPAGETTIELRLRAGAPQRSPFDARFAAAFELRRHEADEFYAKVAGPRTTAQERLIQRQAFAGLLWSKQFYHYIVQEWLDGDPAQPPPPPQRLRGRNSRWRTVYAEDVISMPDAWEYPWFAAWDLAFHVVTFALIDPDFAKDQLVMLTREWYMHPNGQLPAYEWAFDDVNPPVHAWAALRVYEIERAVYGRTDRPFLERVFQKLLLNFTWWLNRKDADDNDVFQGGFLGLDNIGVFDRSAELPTGGHIDQSDGTSWMGVYALNMLAIALELAPGDMVYEDIASKFFEHFLFIADAMNKIGERELALWDDADGMYYDVLHMPNGEHDRLRVRSMVGVIPLLGVALLEPATLDALPGFTRRLDWFIEHRPDLAVNVARMESEGVGARRLLAIADGEKLRRVLAHVLDPAEFLSPYGLRSLSKYHEAHPFRLVIEGQEHIVAYEPAESRGATFGGNSNWRGPVWFPTNYLLIEALQRYYDYFGDEFRVACPTGGERLMTLREVADELAARLVALFEAGADGARPAMGVAPVARDPHWRDLVPFFEYFHAETGAGLGAAHQTGWTATVALLIQRLAQRRQPG